MDMLPTNACPLGFSNMSAASSSCYFLSKSFMTHARCEQFCRETYDGARLACIASEGENAMLEELLPKQVAAGALDVTIWMGMYRDESGWARCTTGEPVNQSRSSWAPRAPTSSTNQGQRRERNCARLTATDDWHWRDETCWFDARCLCEYDSSATAGSNASDANYLAFARAEEASRAVLRRRVSMWLALVFLAIVPIVSMLACACWCCTERLRRSCLASSSAHSTATRDGQEDGQDGGREVVYMEMTAAGAGAGGARLSGGGAGAGTGAGPAPAQVGPEDDPGGTIQKLQAAERAAARLRSRIGAVSATVGWVAVVFCLSNAVSVLLHSRLFSLGYLDAWYLAIGTDSIAILQIALFPWAVMAAALGLRPIDKREIGRAGCLFLLSSVGGGLLLLYSVATRTTNTDLDGGARDFQPRLDLALSIFFLVIAGLVASASPWCPCPVGTKPRTSREQLLRLWLGNRALSIALGLYFCANFIGRMIQDANNDGSVWSARALYIRSRFFGYYLSLSLSFLTAGLLFTPHVRGHLIRRLGASSASGSKEQEAAVIAALASCRSTSSMSAFLSAKRLFRGLPASFVDASLMRAQPRAARAMPNVNGSTPSQIHGNRSREDFVAMTVPAPLGQVAAFVTYSCKREGTAPLEPPRSNRPARTAPLEPPRCIGHAQIHMPPRGPHDIPPSTLAAAL